ncbi:MAG: hypothetical protein DIU79_11760 [Actinobacteria bacterium]|nr:MAG: hypothetical protein DIU79_11760 [Actinomycetota bacterium]
MSSREPTGQTPRRPFTPDFLTELFRNPLEPGYAAAAARRAKQPPPRWQTLLFRAVTVVTVLLIGFLLAVAYRQTLAQAPGRAQARSVLVEQIKQRDALTDELQQRADALREEVSRHRDLTLSGFDSTRLKQLEAVTGLGRVRGDGVVVELADAPATVNPVTGEEEVDDLGRVLDRDLQDVANALWSAGAEAIAINGQRLTATSTIRAAGRAIVVDFRPIAGPYEVAAIGPKEMERRFRDSPAARLMRQVATDHGLSFSVRAARNLVLPAAGEPRLRYAQPVPSASPNPSRSGSSASATSPAALPPAFPSTAPSTGLSPLPPSVDPLPSPSEGSR